MDPFADTSTPHPPGATGADESTARTARIDLLFHFDLRRIGERSVLGALPPGEAVTVGRNLPLFASSSGTEPRPILDRAVSREQLRVTFSPERGRFLVEPIAAARLSIEEVRLSLSTPAFREIKSYEELVPGTLIAIGRRVLLLLRIDPAPEEGETRGGLLGESDGIWTLRRQVRTAARFGAHVLLVGDTGSGKERVARAIHEAQGSAAPLHALNMSGLDATLAGAELFGHVRGAYTGAHKDQPGAFAVAAGGTLFLDEIGDVPLDVQKKLLRVLDEGRYAPLGSRTTEPVRCRIIAASNKPLGPEIEAGRFRRDLYERLAGLLIEVPPLRAHPEDVPLLFASFLEAEVARCPELGWMLREGGPPEPTPLPLEFFVDLMRDPWPGNVRALRNRAVATAAANLHRTRFEPPRVTRPPPTVGEPAATARDTSERRATGIPSRAALVELLDRHDYNQVRVARSLEVSRTTLLQWLRAHGIRRPKDLSDDEIEAARRDSDGDLAEMARVLRVSPHGLKLRLAGRSMSEPD